MFPDKIELQDFELLSNKKFLILCIVTFNFYNIWWIFKAWRFFRDHHDHNIHSAFRAFFSIFFLFGLFRRINNLALENNNPTFSSLGFFLAFVFVSVLGALPLPFSLVAYISPFLLIPALNSINKSILISNKFVVSVNEAFSKRQVILLVFGGIFWSLILVGLLFYGLIILFAFLKP